MRKLAISTALILTSYLSAYDATECIFTNIYDKDAWGGGSGFGSRIENAVPYVAFLQHFIRENHIKSVIDVGCGDWQFSQYIKWGDAHYKGYDIVNYVIEKNREKFSSPTVEFIHGNAVMENLPEADLLVCKDVLQHLSYADIFHFLTQLPKFKYCLITNDVNPDHLCCENVDIQGGGYRLLDLTRAPFYLKGIKVLTYRCGGGMKQTLFISRD